MTEPETENGNPALEEATRELQAARHDAQVAFDCIALGDIDRAHTHALTAKVAADAAVTALAAALSQSEPAPRRACRTPPGNPGPMDHAVIPAPARFDAGGGPGFAFRPGTVVAYADTPHRAGRRAILHADRPAHGLCAWCRRPADAAPDEPSVRIELAAGRTGRRSPRRLGIAPEGGGPPDERHSLVIDASQVVLRAVEPAGVARGLTTLVQLLTAAPASSPGEIRLPAARILDAPRYAWRGLSLDVARTFFTLDEVRRVIDLLAFYKLNVLHLHLTDDRAGGSPSGGRARTEADDACLPRRRPPPSSPTRRTAS